MKTAHIPCDYVYIGAIVYKALADSLWVMVTVVRCLILAVDWLSACIASQLSVVHAPTRR